MKRLPKSITELYKELKNAQLKLLGTARISFTEKALNHELFAKKAASYD